MTLARKGPAIAVHDLHKSYGETKAVNGLSFSVAPGEIFGMLGPNGAGKSTTLEIIIGLRRRDGGQVEVLGADPQQQPMLVKSRIGVQLQTIDLFPRLTVREVVHLFASFAVNPLDPAGVLAEVGLTERSHVRIKELSGGQLQRVGVAIALVSNGDILFLDEPTSALDPQSRRQIWDVLLGIKRQGKTIFLTTHFMDEAQKLCDRVAIVDHGQVIAVGTPRELIEQHTQESALEFVQPRLANDQRLLQLTGVTRMESGPESITLYTKEITQTISDLMQWTRTLGIPLDEFHIRQASLEDVFLKLTGRRIRN
jgi:ABC-2 type transport system ATP-binding protein